MRESRPYGSVQGALSNERPYRELQSYPRTLLHLLRSGPGRYCCKSPKSPGANFSAVKKIHRRPLIRVPSIALPRSPVSLSSGDEVPHIFTRKSRVRPKEILMTSVKGLLQQNLPGPDVSTCSNPLSASLLVRHTLQCVRWG